MKTKISNITLFTALTIAFVFSTIILWNMHSTFFKFSENNKIALRAFYTDQQKELIKKEVERLVKRIYATRKSMLNTAEQNMKDQVRSAENFILNLYLNHNSGQKKELIENMIASFKWDSRCGYFYIFSGDGTVKYHGARPELVGKNIYSLKNEFPDLMDFLGEVKANGSAMGRYHFYKPGKGDEHHEKIGYAIHNETFGMIIGTGYYLENLDEMAKREVMSFIADERFGYQDYGYFWVFTTAYETVFHISPDLYNSDLKTLMDTKNKLIIKDFVEIAKSKGRGFSSYFWNLPNQAKDAEKISYLVYIPDWDWIVGSGFYFENFYDLVNAEEKISNDLLKQEIIKNIIIICSLFVFTLVVSIFIYKRIRNIEYAQEIYVSELLQYKTVIDTSAIVSITDLSGHILHVNDEMCEITGYKKDDFIGSTYSKLNHPDNPASTFKELWETIARGETWRGIIKNFKKNGGYYFQKTTIVPFKNKDGEVIKYFSISHDVTEVFENKSQLQKYLHYDTLTELSNRNSLLMEIKNSKSADLAIIDIDDFHKINDTYGMKIGDMLLKMFALRLTESDHLHRYYIYRLHSDVFAVFSTRSDKNLFVINVENAVKDITKKTFLVDDKELMVSTITGYAHGSDNIMAHADAALQFAKANNISHYAYDPLELDNKKIYEQNTRVVKMLNSAIDEDRVVPFFQPITGSGRPKYECLMRLLDKDGGVISPAEFLEISKQTRFYPTLTKIIVKKSIDTFADDDSSFSVNISTEDILNNETMAFVNDYAVEKNVMSRMILEIVESEQLSSYAYATETLSRFKDAGSRIAIDDFGTGYSNFDYLLKIKADFIKIDGSIIKLITKDERAVDIVNSIVSYAKKLNMKTIAEFISDEALSVKAKALGIDYQQGYFHGKPEPVPNKSVF